MTTLLISAGTAFSATSPLHYTLCWDNNYAHTGVVKESMYLFQLNYPDQWKKRTKRNRQRKKIIRPGDSKPTILTGDSKYCLQMSQEHKDEFLKGKVSLENYINYFERHWEIIKDDYKAVADFSNLNACLSEEFMQSIKPKLLEHFDVKVVMVFRDPVRRLWSVCNKSCQYQDDNVKYLFKKWVGGELEPNAMYSDIYKRHRNVWGEENVHMIVMEEFWSGKVQPLSEFLNFPIKTVHENVYWPDKGSKAPHYDYLWDQWISNTHDLDLKTWAYGMNNMSWVYKDFKNTFGYIPDKWGQWYET